MNLNVMIRFCQIGLCGVIMRGDVEDLKNKIEEIFFV